MGKMSKKNLEVPPEAEVTSGQESVISNKDSGARIQDSGVRIQDSEARIQDSEDRSQESDDFGGIRFAAFNSIVKIESYADGASLLGLSVALLNIAKQKVDPEITAGNPIWKWCLADDHCTFVFRDWRKVRVEL